MSPAEETGLGEHASAWDVVEDPYGDPEGFWTVKQEATGSASQKLPLRQVMGKRLEEIKSGTKEAHENTPVVGEAAGRWPGPRGGAGVVERGRRVLRTNGSQPGRPCPRRPTRSAGVSGCDCPIIPPGRSRRSPISRSLFTSAKSLSPQEEPYSQVRAQGVDLWGPLLSLLQESVSTACDQRILADRTKVVNPGSKDTAFCF